MYNHRKPTRLPNYDYSTDNYYFVTICTYEKKCIFGSPDKLNIMGNIAKADLLRIPEHFQNVKVDHLVVMPNHIHAIIVIGCNNKEGTRPKLDIIIGQYKSGVSRKIRKHFSDTTVWQRSFHDHIIRSRASYEKIWEYIETNPLRWEKDCFYQPVGEGFDPPTA